MKNNIAVLIKALCAIIGKILFVITKLIVRLLLWVSRKLLKPYLKIETPIYKLWWKHHRTYMQAKLDKARQDRMELKRTSC